MDWKFRSKRIANECGISFAVDGFLRGSFAVRNPDIFHLVGMPQIPAAFALRNVEEIDVASLICPHLFQVAYGKRLRARAHRATPETPDPVEIVVSRQDLK